MRTIKRRILKSAKRSVNNKKGMSLITPIVFGVLFLLAAYVTTWYFIALNHEAYTSRVDKVCASMLDAISENRQINDAIITHYQEDLNLAEWYIKDYNIKIKTLDIPKGGTASNVTQTTIVNLDKGEKLNRVIEIPKNKIVRIEIKSKGTTRLTSISKMAGSDAVADVVGYAEGSVD
ncbi:hypothetical protein [Clostridium paraputrificum]|uniref:Uncharacterized protein n=1 Tax=Clostridium paraputrificum TaxID=29363 RepID=A0A6N3F6W7_9CLOT